MPLRLFDSSKYFDSEDVIQSQQEKKSRSFVKRVLDKTLKYTMNICFKYKLYCIIQLIKVQ